MTYYERIMQNRSRKPTLSPAASLYAKKEDEEKKNKGGLLGGIGYLAHKLGLGFLQGIEGVWDYAAGGIADLFGGDDWAKDQFNSDWFNYNAADDWFDPGEGWKVAGDVAGGMGTSLPGMLTAAGLTIATGGTAAPAALGLLVGSLSAAGTSTKEAMQQSGELTGKEYLYGAGMGAVEAVTEKLSGGLGTGITKAAKSVGKAFGKVAAKETAEAAVKSAAKKGVALSLKTAAKQAGKEFASEAFEEGFSEWIAPYIARVTYDPSAENATPGQILYSALIGGLSGVGMAGTTGAFVQYKNYRSGKSIEGESRAQQIIDLARIYTDETASNAEEAVGIRELYAKLASDVESGAALSTEQKRKLGELNAFETAVQLSPMVQRSAIGVIGSADAVAERLNAAGRYKIVDGRLTDTQSTKVEEGASVRDITAEDIRGKYDAKNKGSLAKELRENDVLRYLAASDAAGRLMMGAEDVEKAILSGTPIQSQADLNEFITKASAEKKAAVGKELGIEDWNTLTVQEFANKASAYRESGKAEAYVRKTENIKKMREIESTKARNIPRAIALADGAAAHYADADSDFAIARSGDTFTVYDYTTGNVTRELTRAEVNAELARYRERKSASTVQERATSETANATSEKTSENFSSDAEIEIKDEKISKTAFENEFSEEKAAPMTNSRRITADMTENERYEALKGRMLENIPATSAISESVVDKIPEISSWEDLNAQFGKKKRSIIQTLAKEFGVFDKEYFNDDIKLSFEFSGNNYRESYNKQGKNYIDFAKMFSVFDSVVENAVGIEVHKRTDYKTDPTLENVFVLMSAYQDADSIIPVKLEVKKFKDKKNTLYVAISLNKIKKTEVLKQGNTENGVTQNSRSVTISIAKIFEKINPSDKSFLKYIPDGFLNEEQKKAKREAIEADKRKSTKKAFESELSEEKAAPTLKQIKEAAEARRQDAEIEALAKEKIKDYEDLSKPNQSMIRKVLREARAKGLSDADALSYARVSARTGLDIVFDKKACSKGKNEAGADVYHAGYYDPENNRIVVNPETKKKHTVLLIHELSHAMRSYRKNGEVKYFIDEDAKVSEKMWKAIRKYYADENGKVDEGLTLDEASAYYAEAIFGTQGAIDLLLGEKPTLKQKILSFFAKSAEYYSTDEKLSKEARRHFRKFKALFDAFTARNYGRNAEAKNMEDQKARRFSFEGRTEDGRGIYKSNYPKNTPKDVKQRDIVNLVQNVWSKKPIKLNLVIEGKNVPIEARFNPVLTERSDLSKIAFGNRKGTASEKRITMNLSADLYQIAEESLYVGSKAESGKDNTAHDNVTMWHYFITNLVYIEEDGTKIDCYMNIDVKQNENGNWFYSFAIEKGSRPADVLSVVTDETATTSNLIIPDSSEKSNPSDENFSESGKRFSMDEEQKTKKASNDPNKVTISKGQAQKVKANYNSDRVFSKKDITDAFMGIEGFSNLPYEIRNELFDNIWIGMNSRYSNKKRKIFVQVLLPKIHHTLLTEALTAEGIEKHKEYRKLLKKKRTVEQKLQGEALKKAQAKIDRELEPLVGHSNRLFDNYDRDRIEEIRHEIAVALKNLLASGKSSTLAKTKKEFDATNAGFWREKYYEATDRNRLLNYLDKQARELRDLKIGKYKNMTQPHNDMFKGSIGRIANIEWKGTPNDKMIRSACRDVYAWYTNDDVMKNILFYAKNGDGTVQPGLFNEGIAEALKDISEGKGALSTEELQAMSRIMMYFTNFVEKYGKVYRKGQWVDAYLEVERYINQMNKNKRLRVGLIGKIAKSGFFKLFGDPMSLARRMDFYESGFYTEMLEELRDGAKNAAVYEMELLADYEAFLKENKNYTKKAAKEVVTYRDVQIPKMQLISLYMTLKRRDSRAGFVLNGFEFGVGEGTVDVKGLVSPFAQIEDAEVNSKAEAEIRRIEGMLSEKDRAFISILESAYNGDLKDLKSMRDMQRLGYTNVKDGYYYPQRRVGRSESVDSSTVFDEINRLGNASFNKSTVKGDKHKLYIEAADALFLRHVRAVCQYAGMQPAFDAYNMLYNLDVSGNPNDPNNVAQASKTLWSDGNSYYKKIIEDMQGAKASGAEGLKLLSFIRSGYAKFQLGANPKVWLTQFLSIFASSSILDADAITKGFFTVKGGDVDKYCELAMLRNHDNTAARAQGVLDQPLSARETKAGKLKRAGNAIVEGTGKLGDFTMMPIGFMDRLVVTRLFAACQVQVAKDQKLAIGTEENKIAAGKLLEKVIFETQQNSLYTERSAAMRSSNEIVRALTMFRSDSMKVFGRVLDAAGKIQVLRERIKKAGTKEEKQSLQEEKKRAGVSLAKSVAALLTSAAFMVGVAELFRWAYAKDKDEDEKDVVRILKDFGGNLLAGLPIFADIYTRFVEGYELDNFAYSSINDLANSTASLMSAAQDIFSDEASSQQIKRSIRSLVYSSCQMLGIPTRNAYNLLYGLTKRVSPGTGYKIDSAFYEKNYKTDLEKAIEKGDDKMAMLTLQLLLGERMGEDIEETVFDELLSLSKKGMKVLPRVTPESITVNGETYEFTEDEKAAVADIYEQRNEGLGSLFASSAYKAMTDADKEKAVSVLYDLFYDKALSEALGVDRGNALLFANAIGYGKYAAFKTRISGIASDKDKDGNTVAGSKRAKVVKAIGAMNLSREEKLLLIASSGYSLQDGDIRGISAANARRMLLKYILSMKGTQAEKAALAEACGFEVKNGKILRNSL